MSGACGVTNSEKTLIDIEKTQKALRETIEETKRLAQRSQQLLDKHRREIDSKPKA